MIPVNFTPNVTAWFRFRTTVSMLISVPCHALDCLIEFSRKTFSSHITYR